MQILKTKNCELKSPEDAIPEASPGLYFSGRANFISPVIYFEIVNRLAFQPVYFSLFKPPLHELTNQ
jgi:hypothetical protein